MKVQEGYEGSAGDLPPPPKGDGRRYTIRQTVSSDAAARVFTGVIAAALAQRWPEGVAFTYAEAAVRRFAALLDEEAPRGA